MANALRIDRDDGAESESTADALKESAPEKGRESLETLPLLHREEFLRRRRGGATANAI
jgi:hypothetical protein